jgi:steroid delta-isomerase-like uncharacterized protein
MTRTEIEAFIERHFASLTRHDVGALAADHAEDGIVISPMFSTVEGRLAIESSYRTLFKAFPDWTMTIDDLVVEPPRAAIFSTTHATHENEFFGLPGTRRRIEFASARYMMFEDGLIARERRIYDFTGVLVQLGVLRAKPAKP